ncbi:hypothetical protein BGX26_002938 [Mortierella sp. AD094]|nr:hypothetical protein BGX26_002938 [Mortierella sp. AD094]
MDTLDTKLDMRLFDLLLTDVADDDLRRDISTQLGVNYLSESTPEQEKMKLNRGVVWGPNNRLFVPLSVALDAVPINTHFLIDTGAPVTYLCRKTLRTLGAAERDVKTDGFSWAVTINGINLKVVMSPLDKHFPDINLLGSDFLLTARCALTVNYVSKTCVVELGIRAASH